MDEASDPANRWRMVRLDELERVKWRGSELNWSPLRQALDTRIAGMAIYTAESPDQEVIEGHTETRDGRGHEEVYIVLQGDTLFTLGDDELPAPAGTCISVGAAVWRRAVAREPGTVVLALGGEPRFSPSSSEWIERARPHLRSDPQKARRIIDELRAALPDSSGVAVAGALLAVAWGDERSARQTLAEAIARRPSLAHALATDPDLGHLVETPGPTAPDGEQALAGELCTLRPVRAADLERLAAIQAEPTVARWFGRPDRAHLASKTDPPKGSMSYAIESAGTLVGLIEYEEEGGPEFRHAAIDLFITASHQGKGIGSDAVRTLTRHLIREHGHHRLTLDPAVDNEPAIRAYEKAGFRTVGVMHRYWHSPQGEWRDGLLMEFVVCPETGDKNGT